jgi:PAP2 superfamily
MQTVSLTWQHSGELAAVLAAVGGAGSLAHQPKVRAVAAFVREAAIIGLLYGLWQLAGELSVGGTSGAVGRAHWIEHFEHDIFLPSERSVQQLILGHRLIVETANLYYATMHFTMMFVFLIWLFVRHRDRYRPVRQVMAWTTLCCLLVQLIPVAPPRMLPGIVDTGMRYHQSVYSGGLAVDQLSAMPSVHVAWASFVGFYAWRVSTSRWRYIGFLHTAITVFVVLATGNHYWLDGIVAVLLLTICAWGVYGVRTGWHALLRRWRAGSPPPAAPADAEPAPVPG